MMQPFIRWRVTPEIAGYALPDGFAANCPANDPYEYALPVKWGDKMVFISNVEDLRHSSANTYKIGIINSACENVNYDIGTYELSVDKRQILFKLNIPNLAYSPKGECYRLVWYKEVYGEPTESDWVTISATCVLSANGGNSGFQTLVQEATVTNFTRVPVMVSNPLVRIRQSNRDTKIIQFYDNRNRGVHFGYNYKNFPTIAQRFRLAITVAEWQPSESDSVYRQTNGVFRRGNIYIDEGYTLRTEYFDKATHRALNNALSHAFFSIDGVQYFKFSEYKAEHLESGLNPDRYHLNWVASCELRLQAYNQRNNACDYEPSMFELYGPEYSAEYE